MKGIFEVKLCLMCGGRTQEWEMGVRHKCLDCGFSWWVESSMYLKSDCIPMSYSVRTGSPMIEVPEGCLAVFGDCV